MLVDSRGVGTLRVWWYNVRKQAYAYKGLMVYHFRSYRKSRVLYRAGNGLSSTV